MAARAATTTPTTGRHHAVELYADERSLTETVGRYVGEAIGAGRPAIVIATDAHREAFVAELAQHSIDVERARASGQLTLFDAHETLEQIMAGGDLPDRERFRAIVGGALDAAERARPGRRPCAFGEMVDLLWRQRRRAAAVRLEELWNELQTQRSFTLLCAYARDTFAGDDEAAALARVIRCHTAVNPSAGELATMQKDELSDSETRMRLLIDSIRDYAVFMLDPHGNVVTWNPGAERIKGWRADEIIGRHFSSFYPREDVEAGKCEMELRVAAQTGRFEDEDWRVRKDGSKFWANVVISAVRGANGELRGFAKVTRDLTERRRAEDERAALAAAEQANRAKDQFLAMLGHELRNPLAPIVTALQLMRLRGDTPTREHVIIERQLEHMVRLVDDLLDVSRITQGKIELKREHLELAEIVARSVEIASPLLERRRHRLTVDVPRKGMPLVGDAVRLSQVIANLLTNAAKYTDVEGEVELSAWRDGHEIVLRVKDNGVGIRPELLPHIFELFVQGPRASDRAEGGLGIGLTLVRNLVQLHGGTVVALSDGPGRGSAFVVRLPSAPSGSSAADDAHKPRPTPSVAPRRVLVIDDNVDAADTLAELFRLMGHAVEVAHDGAEALERLQRFTPEVAVVDIGLPVMDGYELAKQLHARLGDACRLIALTGYGQEHDRQRSGDAGFVAHLVKPVDPDRVLRLVSG